MAVLLDAATEHVAIADNAKFDWTPVSQDRTLVLYWKTTSLPNANTEYQIFLQLTQAAGYTASFMIYNSSGTNLLMAFVQDASWAAIQAFYCPLPVVTSDTWYQIVFGPSTNNNCIIRWNGSAQSVTHTTWSDTTPVAPTTIRISNADSIHDNMCIAHLAWFNTLLSQAQTEALRVNPSALDNDAGCLLSLHLDEGSGVTAHDGQTQNTATDGTLTNSPTWAAGPSVARPIFYMQQ